MPGQEPAPVEPTAPASAPSATVVTSGLSAPVEPTKGPLTVKNLTPAEIRRYSTVSFDVEAPKLDGIQVLFQHGQVTEMAWTGGSWVIPYNGLVMILPRGGFRFQVRRADGFRAPPILSVNQT